VTHATGLQRFVPRRALVRLGLALVAGVTGGLLAHHARSAMVGALVGWNIAGIVLLVFSALTISQFDAVGTQKRAGADDPGRNTVYALVVVGSLVSVLAALALAREVKFLPPDEAHVLALLSIVSVGIAWLVTHTAFTLRYAHLYYREDREGIGGLEFPGGARPNYFDFAYFAFTIGMCFQTSDVCISSSQLRRAALLHALVSFAYNTLILALVLNLVFALVA
jgi:uncharacterized membrane protein